MKFTSYLSDKPDKILIISVTVFHVPSMMSTSDLYGAASNIPSVITKHCLKEAYSLYRETQTALILYLLPMQNNLFCCLLSTLLTTPTSKSFLPLLISKHCSVSGIISLLNVFTCIIPRLYFFLLITVLLFNFSRSMRIAFLL